MVLACCVGLVVPAGAALAAPPEHAPAHGRSDRSGSPSRTTTAASAGDEGSASTGRGRGRAHAPGQVKKHGAPDRAPATSASARSSAYPASQPGRAPEPRADRPDTAESAGVAPALADLVRSAGDTSVPLPETSAPETEAGAPATTEEEPAASSTAAPAPGVADSVAAEPAPASTSPTPGEAALPTGRRVIWPDLDGPFRDLLADVSASIGRTVPRDLGPVREPLAEVVPLLLALLGAFLALQRGLGRGLGQVPMVAAIAPRHAAAPHGH